MFKIILIICFILFSISECNLKLQKKENNLKVNYDSKNTLEEKMSLENLTNREENLNDEVSKKLFEKVNQGISDADRKKELIKGYFIYDFVKGNIKGDENDEIIVVIQHYNDEFSNSKDIYILEKNNNEYKVIYKNENLLLNSNEGGAFGDPYHGVYIENNILIVSEYGGGIFR